jgi:hypothetical protein
VRYFLDTEFTDLPWQPRSDLLWVGLVNESGQREFSAINADCEVADVSQFVRENVLPKMDGSVPRLSSARLAQEIVEFVGPADAEFWAWFPSIANIESLANPSETAEILHQRFADWDYQLLRGLFAAPPPNWDPRCRDLHALADATGIKLPPNDNAHDPLSDAQWNRAVWLLAQQSAS